MFKQFTEKQKEDLLLKLEKIAPQWTAVLARKKDNQDINHPTKNLHMMQGACCIVGEAHGFSSKYIVSRDITLTAKIRAMMCEKCDIYCVGLIPLAYGINPKSSWDIEKHHIKKQHLAWTTLAKFIEHFNTNHKAQVAPQ